MKATKEFIVIGVRDSHNNTWIGVVADLNESVVVSGLMDRDHSPVELNGTILELPMWLPSGLLCTFTKHPIEVEFPELTTE